MEPGPGPASRTEDPGSTETSSEDVAPRRIPYEANASNVALSVVAAAFEAVGTPYLWGGNDGNGFDCSGLIRHAYGRHGIELPRISRDQLRMGEAVELDVASLYPGDILGFSAVPGGPATHVGLYVGDGEFIHSSTSGVRVSDLREPYWQRHFMAARRMVRDD
jgi:cell wall-associated NlpC family hydrolase